MLSQKDYEGFQAVLREGGYSAGDFEVSTVDYIDRFERFYPDYTRVSVRYTLTNATGNYIAGCAAYWLRMVESDIGQGTF